MRGTAKKHEALAAVFSLVFLFSSGRVEPQTEDLAASMKKHRYTSRVPVQPYSQAVVDYLSEQAFREHLEKQQDVTASGEVSGASEMDSRRDSQMKWLRFAWTPEEPPPHPEADHIRQRICADSTPGTSNVEELITKGEQLRAYFDTLIREEEEYWQRYYLRLDDAEQQKIDMLIEELPEFIEQRRVRLDLVAAEAPRSFEMYLYELCIRWEQRR